MVSDLRTWEEMRISENTSVCRLSRGCRSEQQRQRTWETIRLAEICLSYVFFFPFVPPSLMPRHHYPPLRPGRPLPFLRLTYPLIFACRCTSFKTMGAGSRSFSDGANGLWWQRWITQTLYHTSCVSVYVCVAIRWLFILVNLLPSLTLPLHLSVCLSLDDSPQRERPLPPPSPPLPLPLPSSIGRWSPLAVW